MNDTPRVAVQCLASYNAGRLIFEWVDATDTDELESARKRVAARAVEAAKAEGEYPVYFGDPEEFMIADYDGFPHWVVRDLGEYPSDEDVARLATLIEDKGLDAIEAAGDVLSDADELDEDWFDAHHRGEWESEEDFCRSVVSEIGFSNLPGRVWLSPHASFEDGIDPFDALDSYLDWESIAREMFRHGNYTWSKGHVFESEV